jgi:Flp pilus assembly protein TadD
MAEISLIDYIYEIEAMLDEGLADDALSHTWHILKHYPKYIKAYRLLGKALKVQSRYREAIAVFQRLLSVLPDDVEVHRLLSVIYHEENLVQTAIYHAERV